MLCAEVIQLLRVIRDLVEFCSAIEFMRDDELPVSGAYREVAVLIVVRTRISAMFFMLRFRVAPSPLVEEFGAVWPRGRAVLE